MPELKLNPPFARGRTADVHAWEDGYILKLFHNWFEFENIEYEMKIAAAVHASGVKSPAVRELVKVEGRNGLIYERVQGISMMEIFQRQPWRVIQLGKTLARLHVEMHNCASAADIPSQQKRLQNKIKNAGALPSYLTSKLLDAIETLPDGNRVCHGDFHPANVLMDGDQAIVIDWIDATCGNPLADVARTSIITLGAAASSQISNPILKALVRLFHSAYLKHYFHLNPGGEREYRQWLPIVAGARLNENIPELETWLIEQAAKMEKNGP